MHIKKQELRSPNIFDGVFFSIPPPVYKEFLFFD